MKDGICDQCGSKCGNYQYAPDKWRCLSCRMPRCDQCSTTSGNYNYAPTLGPFGTWRCGACIWKDREKLVGMLAEVAHALNSYHEEHCRQHPAECADDMLIERAEALLAEVKAP